jgi:YVTN family beta-propeller protein
VLLNNQSADRIRRFDRADCFDIRFAFSSDGYYSDCRGNTSPGGGRSAGVAFTVNAAPSDPLIAGRAGVGSFPAGVASMRRAAAPGYESIRRQRDRFGFGDAPIRRRDSCGRSPAEGIDVDARKDIAVVANPGSNDVSVIDLTLAAVTRTIKVGRFPIGLRSTASRAGRMS